LASPRSALPDVNDAGHANETGRRAQRSSTFALYQREDARRSASRSAGSQLLIYGRDV
jgi:hypothetical protein